MSSATGSEGGMPEQIESLINWAVWGDQDQLGTVNHIDPDKRLRALSIPSHGVAVGLGRTLHVGAVEVDQEGQFSSVTQQVSESSVNDEWELTTHGFGMTHLDALAHTIYDGQIYGGRSIADVLGPDGLTHGSILAYGSGIITRGVLLDITRVRGVEYLEQGDGVSRADLDQAAEIAGVDIEPGDATFIRVGLQKRRAAKGFDGDDVRAGVLPEVNHWLHEKRVAVYSGDCIERLPSGSDEMSHPLHQVGQVFMGLCTLDIPDMETLADACTKFGTFEFLLIVAPLRVEGASGSPVNPLAIF